MERPTLIQVYLEAKSKDELIVLMANNNLSKGFFYRYSTPVKEGKKWVTWYYKDMQKDLVKKIDIKEHK